MKSNPIILLFLLSLFVYSCTDNLSDIGSGIQPTSDQIKIGTDTFHLTSETAFVDFMYSKPDSFLLGNYYNTKFGSTQADILAQVNCPVGFKFPPLSVADSASVVLVYYSWYGNKYAPLDVNIYEMNKSTFIYPNLYKTNLDPNEFTDRTLKLSERIFSAKDAGVMRADSNSIKFPLSTDFVQRFFKNTDFSSTDNFLKQFKGIYITANYGAATLLNISRIYINYYYHYTYIVKNAQGGTVKNVQGGDSIVTVKNSLPFPANSEVRQVNRFVHDADRAAVVRPADNVSYVASPANLNTRVGIPLNRIQQRMDAGIANKKLTINSALIKVEATDVLVDTVSMPTVRYMLLVKESASESFFNNKELPSDTCAVLAAHVNALVAYSTTLYEDYYKFSVAKLIANELKIAKLKNVTPADKLNMILVPVQVTFDTSGNVTSVKKEYLMSGVTILGGKDTTSPMRINVVYSGF